MSDARTLLERLVRAEWQLSDACDAGGHMGHSVIEKAADKEWGLALKAAIAFLGVERPPSVFAELEVPMSKENRAIVQQNMQARLDGLMRDNGWCNCPTCGQLTDVSKVKAA